MDPDDDPGVEPAAGNAYARQNFFENETTIYDLDINTDIEISGAEKWDSSGYTIATGDIDGDGYDDMLIGAYDAISGPNNDRYSAGEVYVVYGAKRDSISPSIDLSKDADIILYGVDDNDHTGETLACGDITGDGKAEIIIGVPGGDGPGNTFGQEDTGEIIVIFGNSRNKLPAEIDLSRGTDLTIFGVDTKDFAGSALAVGNIDNDNFNDLIISADHADGPGGKRTGVGDVYVFYGQSNFGGTLKCSNADFIVYGNFWGDSFGRSVAVGDFNNDNYDDMVIGAPNSFGGPSRNLTFNGECYVVLGDTRSNLGKTRDLENLTYSDMTIYGGDEKDYLGTCVAAADLDGDGYDDIIVGAGSADGPGNARKNSGDVYVIRGGNNLARVVDLANTSNADMVIYGADPKDKAGEALAVGDMNGDGIRDMIIGAGLADGKHNTDPSAGEVYVIFGNISFSSGTERDLATTGADLIIYSTEANVQAGLAVASGDIDNDGKYDIFLGAPYSDVNNGSIQGAGKTYIIYGTKVLERLKNIGMRLDGVEDRRKPVCYADYMPYSFVVNVTDSIGITDIESVRLTLDPAGENIQLVWRALTDEFREESDPDDLVELLSTSDDSRAITDKLVELRFTVMFSGDYPDEAYSDAEVVSKSAGGLKDTDMFDRIYSVENDLDYTGTLQVESEFQGPLTSGSWIQSNETVKWSGLTVVYQGTENRYPPNDYFELILEDDDGDSWSNGSSSGRPFTITSEGDSASDFSDLHTLYVQCPYDAVFVPEPIQYELKVASPNVTFDSPQPQGGVWYSTDTLNCSITITDQSGGLILGLSIQYAVSTSGPFGYGLWQDAGVGSNGVSLTPELTITFADGDDNYIKWRAKSAIGTLGDIYSGSPGYRIKIDTTPVVFRDVFPEDTQWEPRLAVNCGISVSDLWTGVESSSVAYSYSTTGISGFGPWISAGLTEDSLTISVEVTIDLVEGIDNYIRWRADDVIGTGMMESEAYRIKVSTQKPVATLFQPEDSSELSSTSPTLLWRGFDPNDDEISYDIYLGTDLARVSNLDEGVMVSEGRAENSLETADLKENTRYYWTVIPSDGEFNGICESGVWMFDISEAAREPEAVLQLPLSKSILNITRVDLIWSIEHFSILELEFKVYVDTSPVPLKLYKTVKSSYKVTVEGLKENVKYYWTVIPVHNNILGVCGSGVWSFSVNRTYTQSYGLSLSVNASHVTIPWNTSWAGYLELENLGNGVDDVELTMYAGGMEDFINATTGLIMLDVGQVFNSSIIISIPDGFPARSYNIIFQAGSRLSGEREIFILIVEVVGSVQYYKGYEEFDQPTDTRPPQLPIVDEVPELMRNILIVALIMVILVAVTVILIIRHAVNKANERAILRLKQLIAKRKKELGAASGPPSGPKRAAAATGKTGSPEAGSKTAAGEATPVDDETAAAAVFPMAKPADSEEKAHSGEQV